MINKEEAFIGQSVTNGTRSGLIVATRMNEKGNIHAEVSTENDRFISDIKKLDKIKLDKK